jgi:HK97 family phage major capsid protein
MSDANVFIEHLEKCRPRLVWYVEESTFAEIREMRDVAGVTLWQPDPAHEELPGTFLSCEVCISDKNTGTELVYVFPDGTEKRVPMSG